MLTAPILLRYLALFVPVLGIRTSSSWRAGKLYLVASVSNWNRLKNGFLLEMMKFVKLKAVVSDVF